MPRPDRSRKRSIPRSHLGPFRDRVSCPVQLLVLRHGFNKIPAVPERVAPHGHDAIGFMAGRFLEHDASGLHRGMVAREVIRLKEQENPPAGLIADRADLCRPISAGQNQPHTSARWFKCHPALVTLIGIFAQTKAQLSDVKANCRIIVRHDQR